MTNKKTGVGFVGCGGFAAGNHIPSVYKNSNMEIIGFCDLNEVQLKELSEKFSPKYTTTDMEEIFKDKEVDFVICSTKPDFRIPIMEMAVKYNKPLFVEKPLCMTEEEMKVMVPLIKNSGLPFMVGFNRPYSPMMQDLRELYRENKKGSTTIIYRIIGEAQIWPKHHYDAVMVEGESTIIHEVTHIFDALNWLTGELPKRVYVEGEGNTDNVITLSYPDNITAVIIAGDNSTVGYPKERIEINTNYQALVGDYFSELSQFTENGREFYKQYPLQDGNEGAEFIDTIRGIIDKLSVWRKNVTPEEMAVGYYYDKFPKCNKGHYAELEYFRQQVVAGKESETGVVQGAIANITAWEAYKSWEDKAPKKLDFSWLNE